MRAQEVGKQQNNNGASSGASTGQSARTNKCDRSPTVLNLKFGTARVGIRPDDPTQRVSTEEIEESLT